MPRKNYYSESSRMCLICGDGPLHAHIITDEGVYCPGCGRMADVAKRLTEKKPERLRAWCEKILAQLDNPD